MDNRYGRPIFSLVDTHPVVRFADLPSDFLSTEFGRALRPTIDRMYTGLAADSVPSSSQSASLLQSVAEAATASPPVPRSDSPSSGLSSVVSPIHVSTNLASFQSVLASHRAVVAFFTSSTCGPCRFIEPTFEEIAEQKSKGVRPGLVAFVKVDIQVGAGHQLASLYSVRVTPTFVMFLNQQKVWLRASFRFIGLTYTQRHEIGGVNIPELRAQVDMLLFEAFPRKPIDRFIPIRHLILFPNQAHVHSSLSLPHLAAVSTDPIIFKMVTSLDAVATKLSDFIDSSELPMEEKARVKHTIESEALPFLRLQILPSGKSAMKPLPSLTPMLTRWTDASKTLVSALPTEQLFPLVDLWRIGFLSMAVGTWVSEEHARSLGVASSVISEFLKRAELKPLPRSFILTLLKCLSNAFGSSALSRRLLAPGLLREKLTDLAVSGLLEADGQVRAAAASLVFNIASCAQAQRVDAEKRDSVPQIYTGPDVEWEIEVVSAVIEGIRREESEDIREFSASLKSSQLKAPSP